MILHLWIVFSIRRRSVFFASGHLSYEEIRMGLVTLTQFNTYTGNLETGEAVNSMKNNILAAAEEIVVEHLGYNPVSGAHEDIISGIGNNRLYLFAHPVTSVTAVSIDGVALDLSEISLHDTYIRRSQGIFPNGVDNVSVSYVAGWAQNAIPDTIITAILQIASLMLQETGGNIGITGKSFAENSRTFINYTNFSKWLQKLDSFRIVRFV